MKISAVVNTRNEAEALPGLLKSLDFVDEIIVVDMQSADGSPALAKKFKAKVYQHKPLSFVEPARNFGIRKATSDWILVLDPDERIPRSLALKLEEISKNKEGITFVRIPRKNIIFGKWIKHSRWWPDYNIRFFKKGAVKWSNKIHSIPVTRGRGIDLEAKQELAIVHQHYQSASQYILRMDRYTSVQAEELLKQGQKVLWPDFVKKPLAEFIGRFFAGKGYKDGLHGLVLSGLQAFSEFVVLLKLWERRGFEKQFFSLPELEKTFLQAKKEISFWIRSELIASSENILMRLLLRFKRKVLK